MNIKYNEIEKFWSVPDNKSHNCGLGEAILTRLNEDNPGRVLEVFYDNGIKLTVSDVRSQTITVAQNLQRIGLKKGDTVVLYSMSNENITPIVFACYTIGAPVNFFETNLEGDSISKILKQLDPTIIILEEVYRSRLTAALESLNLQNLKHVLSIGGTATPSVDEILFAECGNIDSFQPPVIEDPKTHPATLMLTSGTTDLPKIVIHSHSIMMKGLYSWWDLEPGDKIFSFSFLRWISQVSMMLQPVFLGVQRFFTSQAPSAVLGMQIIDDCQITHCFTVPAMYSDVLRAAETSGGTYSLSSLRMALVSGEVVKNTLLDHMLKIIPNCKAVQCYGMTELGGLGASEGNDREKSANRLALKRGFMAKIIDDNNEPLGPNEMGRLCMKIPSLPYLKYLKNDKANMESFLEGGWLNTGDYGFVDSDNLVHILTRYEFLVRSGGNVIIPCTVEHNIESHPSVWIAVMVGHQNTEQPGDEIGTVFVVLRNGLTSENIESDLRVHLEAKCTKEEACAIQCFRVISEIPLTSCGKTDRNRLRQMACLALN